MNPLIFINYLIFAIVLSFLMLEMGVAILSLIDFEKYKTQLMGYIAPIWEITGTFGVFYLVNLAATYPGLLPAVDHLYVAPILISVVLIIAKNALLAFSELSSKSSKSYFTIYGVCTLIVMFILFSILTSSVAGTSVNLAETSINPTQFLLNPFNLLFFGALVTLVSLCTIIFFNVKTKDVLKDMKVMGYLVIITLLLLILALVAYTPYIIVNMFNEWYFGLIVFLLLFLITLSHVAESRYSKHLVLAFLIFGVFSFECLEYPTLFNGAVNLNSYVVQQPSASYILLISVLGGIFLTVSLGIFMYIAKKSRRPRPNRPRKPKQSFN